MFIEKLLKVNTWKLRLYYHYFRIISKQLFFLFSLSITGILKLTIYVIVWIKVWLIPAGWSYREKKFNNFYKKKQKKKTTNSRSSTKPLIGHNRFLSFAARKVLWKSHFPRLIHHPMREKPCLKVTLKIALLTFTHQPPKTSQDHSSFDIQRITRSYFSLSEFPHGVTKIKDSHI